MLNAVAAAAATAAATAAAAAATATAATAMRVSDQPEGGGVVMAVVRGGDDVWESCEEAQQPTLRDRIPACSTGLLVVVASPANRVELKVRRARRNVAK